MTSCMHFCSLTHGPGKTFNRGHSAAVTKIGTPVLRDEVDGVAALESVTEGSLVDDTGGSREEDGVGLQ